MRMIKLKSVSCQWFVRANESQHCPYCFFWGKCENFRLFEFYTMTYYRIILICSLVTFMGYFQLTQGIPESWFRHKTHFRDANDQDQEASSRQDQEEAPAKEHDSNRVQIKVYRGPDDEFEHFAPYGYWVKQPADDDRHR